MNDERKGTAASISASYTIGKPHRDSPPRPQHRPYGTVPTSGSMAAMSHSLSATSALFPSHEQVMCVSRRKDIIRRCVRS